VVKRRGVLARIFGWVVRIGLALLLLLAVLMLLWRFAPPVSTLMVARWATLRSVDRQWVPLERISPRLVASVITSEDARFCRHGGVDWDAINVVLDTDGGPTRGASTIAMQTTKNLFLWPSRSYIRKGLEVPLALVLDFAWSKRRVMEVYLNIAEWGDGIFGAEAAARRYFGKSAAALTAREAALLAAALPNPRARDPRKPPRRHALLARIVERRAQAAGGLTDCLR
jgi:monofunctional biosynthetic peptidoglycan transglycosylase